MKAETYLQQLVYLECKIKGNAERVRLLKESAENRTSKLSQDKVQSGGSKDRIGDNVCSYAVLEKRIEEDERKKQEILDTIGLLKPYESAVIYKCYVEQKFLVEIAAEMKKSYSWVTKMHRQGLKRLQAILDERENTEV